MNVLFLSIGGFEGINVHDQYPDFLREFKKNGHKVFVLCAREKRYGLVTELQDDDGAKILRVRVGNITQSNMIEKGIATVMIERQYKAAVKKYFANVKFDLVLYTTPPITLVGVVEYIKKKDKAITYLLLKDIFPQNAVDIGLLSTTGLRGMLYRYFRNKEKKLYEISDRIGTMSQANSEYIFRHNPEIDRIKFSICPNCLEVRPVEINEDRKKAIRIRYGIPLNRIIFVYGGNLGKPQDIPFVIECIKKARRIKKAFFWIIGNGTEYSVLETFVNKEIPDNIKLDKRLPKDEFDQIIAACDVGLVFLDHRFTIPNFPSRILSYMQAGLPVLACTDSNTDIGRVIMNNGFGWWCESDDSNRFVELVEQATQENLIDKITATRKSIFYYDVKDAYSAIMRDIELCNKDIV